MQQKFTHGRSKNVTVEVRRTRTYKAGSKGSMVEVKAGGDAPVDLQIAEQDGLTEEERQARLKVLENAEQTPRATSGKLAHQELEEQEATQERAKSKDGVVTSPLLEKQKQEKEEKVKVSKVAQPDEPAHATTGSFNEKACSRSSR